MNLARKGFLYFLGIIIFLWIILFLISCKTAKPLINENRSETIINERIIHFKDTIEIPAAEAIGEALFYCDSLGSVRLSYIKILEADKLNLQLLYDDVLQKLKVIANIPKDTIYKNFYIQVADTTQINQKIIHVPFPIEKEVYPVWLVILAMISIFFIGFKFFKFFKK